MPAVESPKAADVTMAQTSSAQREPSMEEILASIRRIIEDSDTVRQPAADEGEAAPIAAGDASSETMKAAETDIVESQVEAFRAEFDPEPAEQKQAPLSMADIQASVRGEPAPMAEIRHFRNSEADAPAAPAVEPPVASQPVFEEPAPDSPAPNDPPAARPSAVSVQAPLDMPRTSILSDRAGRQVAAAFGELSEAFAATRRRSFDEMAEEMIRPMLQDWLDNNLPTLVERLVREEIERVARGG